MAQKVLVFAEVVFAEVDATSAEAADLRNVLDRTALMMPQC